MISESLVGRETADTRQNAGTSLKLGAAAPGNGGGVPSGRANSPAATDCASVMVVCGIASELRLSHVAAASGSCAASPSVITMRVIMRGSFSWNFNIVSSVSCAWWPAGQAQASYGSTSFAASRVARDWIVTKLSSGNVSPRASSSRASRAMRRIKSRFAANRCFHASSSARNASICDAMASCSSGGRVPTFSRAFSSKVLTVSGYQTATLAIE